MQIIDNEGRVFGKINVIDLTIGILAVCLLFSLILAIIRINDRRNNGHEVLDEALSQTVVYLPITIQVTTDNRNLLTMIKTGDRALNEDGKTIAQITSTNLIKERALYDAGGHVYDTTYTMLVYFNLTCQKDYRGIRYLGDRILFGKSITIDYMKYSLTGKIIYIGDPVEQDF